MVATVRPAFAVVMTDRRPPWCLGISISVMFIVTKVRYKGLVASNRVYLNNT